jgi:hypothetical protein
MEVIKNKSYFDKKQTQFDFLSKYARFGIVSFIVLLMALMFVFVDISENVYTACVLAICVYTLFVIYRVYIMPSKTSLQEIMSTTFTMCMTIVILIGYTIFCVSDVSEDMDKMPSGWSLYVKVFISILILQSFVGFYSLFLTNENNHWILCTFGATLNILLFIFFLFVYTITKNFRTDGFLV